MCEDCSLTTPTSANICPPIRVKKAEGISYATRTLPPVFALCIPNKMVHLNNCIKQHHPSIKQHSQTNPQKIFQLTKILEIRT